MAVLSLQSHVAYGHVGNSAAAFVLQRLGLEVWAVNSVTLSNHPGYGTCQGRLLPPEEVAALLEGLYAQAPLADCRAVLSGYLGDPAVGPLLLEAVARVKAANPAALFLCDPVMGDKGPGFYVRPGVPEFLRAQALPRADVLTPNHFELEVLSGRPVATLEDALAAARHLLSQGPRLLLVTSLRHEESRPGEIELLAVAREGAWRVATPFLAMEPQPNGAGDALSALFLAHLLAGAGVPESLERAASAIYGVIEATAAEGRRELALIAAQEELAAPSHSFRAERVG